MNEPAVFGTNEEKYFGFNLFLILCLKSINKCVLFRPFNWPEDRNYTWSLKCPDDEYENVRIKASYLYDTETKKNKREQEWE